MEWLLQKLDFSKLINWLKEALPSFSSLFDGLAGILPSLGFGGGKTTNETSEETTTTVTDNLNDFEKGGLSVVSSLVDKFKNNAELNPKLSKFFVDVSGELKSNADIDLGEEFKQTVNAAREALEMDATDDATIESVISGIFNEESDNHTKLAKIIAVSDKVATLNQALEVPTGP